MPTDDNPAPEGRSKTGKASLETLQARIEAARVAKEAAEREPPAPAARADRDAPRMDIRPKTESLKNLQGMSERLAERKRQARIAAGEEADDSGAETADEPPAQYVPKSYYEPAAPARVPEGAPSTATGAAASEVSMHAISALREHPGVVLFFSIVFALVVVAEVLTWPSDGGWIDFGGGSGGAGKHYEVEAGDLAVMLTATNAAEAGVGWPSDHDIDESNARTDKVKLSDGSYQTSYFYDCSAYQGDLDEYDEYDEYEDFGDYGGSDDYVKTDVLYCKKDDIAEEWYRKWSDHYRGRGDWGGGAIETRNDQFRAGDESFWGVIVDESGTTTFFVGRKDHRVFRMSIQNANLPGNELERLISTQLERLDSYKP